MAEPLFSAVGMFDGGPLFAMPLSMAVPASAKRTRHRRPVVAVELAGAIPGLGALSGPLSGRAVLAMILAFFVSPFNRAVRPDGHDGSGIAGAFHREIISWIAVEPLPGMAKVGGWPGRIRAEARTGLLAGAPRASPFLIAATRREGESRPLRVTIPFAGGARRVGPIEKLE